MAKKTTTSSVKVESTPELLDQFQVSGDFTQADILAIVTANAEELCNEKIHELRVELKGQRKVLFDKRAQWDKQMERFVLSHYDDKVQKLRKLLGIKRGPAPGSVDLRWSDDPDSGKVTCSLEIQEHKRHSVSFPLPTLTIIKQYRKMYDEITDLLATVESLENQVVEWRKRLHSIPSLERKYRAKLASEKLQTTKSGRDFLHNFLGTLPQDVFGLLR